MGKGFLCLAPADPLFIAFSFGNNESSSFPPSIQSGQVIGFWAIPSIFVEQLLLWFAGESV